MNLRLGILGGGQLARMLALQAHALGIQPHVLSESKDDPAAQVTAFHHLGSIHAREQLHAFLQAVDVVTFESEFVNGELLHELQQQVRIPIEPQPLLIQLLQDRLSQKHLLEEHKLPTADFLKVSTQADLDEAIQKFKGRLVLKARRYGYDGYGTFIMTQKDHRKLLENEVNKGQMGFIAEAYVPFKRELACLVVREKSGDVQFFPMVETLQQNHQCLWVKGPLKKHPAPLKAKLKKFLNATQYVGVIAFEMFETSKGLLINEIAPRVHNSGHYSIEALNENQFSAHVKAVTGLKVGDPKSRTKGFAMVNLLGESDRDPSWKIQSDVSFHWYGKKQNRPRRKMGHLTVLGSSPDQALKLALKARKDVKL